MPRVKKNDNSKKGSPEWMTTYGDMVTLLLTFFVMLFSFSTIDAQKWEALVASLTGNIGILEGGKTFSELQAVDDAALETEINKIIREKSQVLKKNDGNSDEPWDTEEPEEFIRLYLSIKEYIEENNIPAELELSEPQTEILIRFKDYILFDTGRATLKPEAKKILDRIAGILVAYEKEIYRIRVEGHADSRPINTFLYPTNWELSGARGASVVRYFQEKHGIPGNKLSFAGYGEYYPIDSNDTPEGRARNRRVEILIIKKRSNQAK